MVHTNLSTGDAEAIAVDPKAAAAVDAYLLMQEASLAGVKPSVSVLAVFGEPGVGKSTLVEDRARQLGLKPFVTSASRHAGSFEADSVANFESDLAKATELGAQSGRIGVLIINDIDQGLVAEKKGVGGTPNVGLLIGRLQHQADEMHASRLKRPCAIIATGNSARNFPESIMRDGRWRFVEMSPSWSIRRRQLLSLVGSGTGARLAAEALMVRYPTRSIAFLAQAAAEARESSILATYEACGRDITKFRECVAAVASLPLSGRALWRAAGRSVAGRNAVMRRA